MKSYFLKKILTLILCLVAFGSYGWERGTKIDNKKIFFEFAAELFGWVEKQVMKVEIGQKSAHAFQKLTRDDISDLERIINIANYDKQ